MRVGKAHANSCSATAVCINELNPLHNSAITCGLVLSAVSVAMDLSHFTESRAMLPMSVIARTCNVGACGPGGYLTCLAFTALSNVSCLPVARKFCTCKLHVSGDMMVTSNACCSLPKGQIKSKIACSGPCRVCLNQTGTICSFEMVRACCAVSHFSMKSRNLSCLLPRNGPHGHVHA